MDQLTVILLASLTFIISKPREIHGHSTSTSDHYNVCVNIDQEALSNGGESDIIFCSVRLENLDGITPLPLPSTANTMIIVNHTTLSSEVIFDGFMNLSISGVSSTNSNVSTVSCWSSNCGLYFDRVQGLAITKLEFVGCGSLQFSTSTDRISSGQNHTVKFKTALYIWRSTDVMISNIGIHNSNGLGMAIFDTNGTVTISDSTFMHNQMLTPQCDPCINHAAGGGGVYIEFTACPPGVLYGTCETSRDYKSGSHYRIQRSTFDSNRASTLHPEKSSFVKLVGKRQRTNFQGLGRGGGLAIQIQGNASKISIEIVDCKFYNNQALSGGGLYVRLAGQATENSVYVESCQFVNNTSNQTGGGVNVGLRLEATLSNNVQFKHCLIQRNQAKTGGGTMLLLNDLGNCSSGQNRVLFTDTAWISNSAEYGAALEGIVYAPRGFGENSILFESCIVNNNHVIERKTDIGLGIQKLTGRGTFKITNMVITFCFSVRFENNTGTALWAVASKVHFECSTTGAFIGNLGANGGAISLISNSILFVHDNTILQFLENKASSKGGAIFSHSVHENSFLLSPSTCSIQYEGETSMESRNVSFIFEGNLAATLVPNSKSDANNGNSIYLTTLHSCVFFCTVNTMAALTVDNFFSCIGKFSFQICKNCSENAEVATQGHDFNVTLVDNNNSTTLYATPGKELELPVEVLDDLSNAIDSVYRVQMTDSNVITIDSAYDYISNRKLKLYGPPLANGTLLIELAGLHDISLTMTVMLLQCPPGYYIEHKKVETRVKENMYAVEYCTCNWEHSAISAYRGIICNQEASTASILHGYWGGYVESQVSPQHFVTANCPLHYCSYNNSNFKPLYLLPDQAFVEIVDQYMCGPSRKGILCAECANGYSVFYHSADFKCKQNSLCKFGWVFFTLSELLPLTLMFVLITVSNVSFTSGAINGFIFFAQVVDSLALNAYDISGLYSPHTATVLTELCELIYRIFNLEFFYLNKLSFCLWEGATTMDMLAFRLVSVVYGLLLILMTVFVIKKCDCHLKRSRFESYVIHGLAAFLILCYVQCAQISFRILNPIYLEGVGFHSSTKLVKYSGNIEYFSLDHLWYALPAVVIISTIVALPPLFLIWYPAGRKLLSKCRLNELKGIQLVEKMLMIDRMKPLLDSFQSNFKDSCRHFAALYFLYRVLVLTTFTLARTLPEFYIVVEIELVIIIAFHAALQPYQKIWHNIVDILIFSDLAVINALSIYIYIKATDAADQATGESISIAIIIRLVFIYLPLIYATSYLIILAVQQLRLRIKGRLFLSGARQCTVIENELPARLLHPDDYTLYKDEHDSL